MLSSNQIEYLRKTAGFLRSNLRSDNPIEREGALLRVRRALPPFREKPDEDVVRSARRTDLLNVVAREVGYSSWRAVSGEGGEDSLDVEYSDHPAEFRGFLRFVRRNFREPEYGEPAMLGPEGDPTLYFHRSVLLPDGTAMHLEAFRVRRGEYGVQELDHTEEHGSLSGTEMSLNGYLDALGAAMVTERFGDAEYAIGMTAYGD